MCYIIRVIVAAPDPGAMPRQQGGAPPRKPLPRKRLPANLRSLARGHTEMALRTLAGIASSGESESARVAAAVHLLDRGWGKPAQTHTDADGEGKIRVVIRHIVEGRDAPRVIDAVPIEEDGEK